MGTYLGVWNYVASGASAIVVSSLFNGLEVNPLNTDCCAQQLGPSPSIHPPPACSGPAADPPPDGVFYALFPQVVRTRQINDGTEFASSKEKQYSNFWAAIARVVREEGLIGAWWFVTFRVFFT